MGLFIRLIIIFSIKNYADLKKAVFSQEGLMMGLRSTLMVRMYIHTVGGVKETGISTLI